MKRRMQRSSAALLIVALYSGWAGADDILVCGSAASRCAMSNPGLTITARFDITSMRMAISRLPEPKALLVSTAARLAQRLRMVNKRERFTSTREAK